MKKSKFKGKLSLNKETLSNLNHGKMEGVIGGGYTGTCYPSRNDVCTYCCGTESCHSVAVGATCHCLM
jgi:hypothetical protein